MLTRTDIGGLESSRAETAASTAASSATSIAVARARPPPCGNVGRRRAPPPPRRRPRSRPRSRPRRGEALRPVRCRAPLRSRWRSRSPARSGAAIPPRRFSARGSPLRTVCSTSTSWRARDAVRGRGDLEGRLVHLHGEESARPSRPPRRPRSATLPPCLRRWSPRCPGMRTVCVIGVLPPPRPRSRPVSPAGVLAALGISGLERPAGSRWKRVHERLGLDEVEHPRRSRTRARSRSPCRRRRGAPGRASCSS